MHDSGARCENCRSAKCPDGQVHCSLEWGRTVANIENVKRIQAGYRAISQFQNKPAPPAAPEIKWPKIDKQLGDSGPFAHLNFIRQFCPPTGPAAVEVPLRSHCAKC